MTPGSSVEGHWDIGCPYTHACPACSSFQAFLFPAPSQVQNAFSAPIQFCSPSRALLEHRLLPESSMTSSSSDTFQLLFVKPMLGSLLFGIT